MAAPAEAVRDAAATLRSTARDRRFRGARARVVYPGASGTGDERLRLYTIAFGNAVAVGHQIRLLRKYLQDDYLLTVVDNSADQASRRRLEAVCRSARTAYVGLPPNPFPLSSRSHGAALNWTWYNLVEPSGRRFVGLLDHDIYPFRPTAVTPVLESSGLLGVTQLRGRRWYLWPGWCFFDRARLGFPRLDFMPKPGLDTGGGNWRLLFRRLPQAAVPEVPHRDERFFGPDQGTSAAFEILGDWVHTGSASGWEGTTRGRGDVSAFLECL